MHSLKANHQDTNISLLQSPYLQLASFRLTELSESPYVGYHNLNSMVQHPVARVLQKFINLQRTQLQSFLFLFYFNLNHTTCFGPSSGHPQV
jgi:hypothetical protein